MLNTVGERITYCRNLLGLARNEVPKKMGEQISLPTLARWELGTVTPSLKKVKMLTDFFISQGLDVKSEWIHEGKGYPPISIDLKKFDHVQFDELAYTTLINIRNKVKNFDFRQVNSNFLRPFISFGDYLGGVTETNKKLIDKKLCFLFSDSIVTAGIYIYEIDSLESLCGETYEVSELKDEVKVGEVQWIIRRP
jgi:transcriptional regulator with XRE-family HTH domain